MYWLNHPKYLDVNLERVCHKVTKLEKDGDYYIGESDILRDTPKGDILYGLLKNKVRIGISTRGAGKIGYDNTMEKFILKAFDIVHDPSGYDCFVNGVFESKEYMINTHGELVEFSYDKLEKDLMNLPKYSEDKKLFIVNSLDEFIKSL